LLRIPRQIARAKSINKALLVDNEVDLVFAVALIDFISLVIHNGLSADCRRRRSRTSGKSGSVTFSGRRSKPWR